MEGALPIVEQLSTTGTALAFFEGLFRINGSYCLKVVLGMRFRKPRRRRLAVLLFTELVVQWINVSFYLVPNINLLAHPCAKFSTLVRESSSPH